MLPKLLKNKNAAAQVTTRIARASERERKSASESKENSPAGIFSIYQGPPERQRPVPTKLSARFAKT